MLRTVPIILAIALCFSNLGFINLGGNIRAWGVPRPGADGWKIAVRDPFRDAGTS